MERILPVHPTVGPIAFRIAGALALCVLLGCQDAPNHVGKWSGKRVMETPPGADPRVAESLKIVELDVKSSGRFTLLNLGMPLEGQLTRGAGKTLLVVDTVMLQPITDGSPYKEMFAKPYELQVKGKEIRVLVDGSGLSEPVHLIRKSE